MTNILLIIIAFILACLTWGTHTVFTGFFIVIILIALLFGAVWGIKQLMEKF